MNFSLVKQIVAAMALSLLAGTAFAEDIRIGAGAAPTENILKPIRAAFEKASGITLKHHFQRPPNRPSLNWIKGR